MLFIIKNKYKLFTILLLLFLVFTLSANITLADEATEDIFKKMSGGLEKTGSNAELPAEKFENSIFGIINTLLTFIGIFFMILVIYGGYLWMTAAGNEEQVAKAKKIIIVAIVGISIIIISRILTEFLLRVVIGESISPSATP